MKRASYVDNQGNTIDHSFESKKTILNIFFIMGTILPIVIIGLMIYTMIDNSNCNKIYTSVKNASLDYLKDEDKVPTVEGDSYTVAIDKLYSGNYLSSLRTNNNVCGGTVKVTKYKSDFLYTLNLTDCNTCTTNGRFGKWSSESSRYPTGKSIVDVIPYYNFFERQISMTEWSKYYEPEDISSKKSKYNIKLPKDLKSMPEVPSEGNIVEAQKEESYQYRYRDRTWKWYDIPGDYSDFSSEQPDGYALKDTSTKIYTKWSEYSLDYPGEKDYRDIENVRGYKFYYEEDGKKVYANNGKYTPRSEVDEEKYNKSEEETTTLYRYRDEMWRWYNGTKRKYSAGYSEKPNGYSYRDVETEALSSYSGWKTTSSINEITKEYRIEEKKILTRFRYVYEILSLPVLEKPLSKTEFEKKTETKLTEFAEDEDYKLDVKYKFKYRKS